MADKTPEISVEQYAAEREPMGQLASRLDEIDRSARVHVICAWLESGRSVGVGL